MGGRPKMARGVAVGRLGKESERRMGYRSFRSSGGEDWHAWDVIPQLAERRVAERRQGRALIGFRDRRRGERRMLLGRRAVLGSGFSDGWLCFEGPSEKRRLSPIPSDWTRCPVAQLQEYCRTARPVRRSTELNQRSSASG
jgi:hypothetical protein